MHPIPIPRGVVYAGATMNNTTTQNTAAKRQTVKILGQLVRVGTKKHAILVQQLKQFNDVAKYETN